MPRVSRSILCPIGFTTKLVSELRLPGTERTRSGVYACPEVEPGASMLEVWCVPEVGSRLRLQGILRMTISPILCEERQ